MTQRGGVSVVELDKLTDIKQSNFMWRRGRKLGREREREGEILHIVFVYQVKDNLVKCMSVLT